MTMQAVHDDGIRVWQDANNLDMEEKQRKDWKVLSQIHFIFRITFLKNGSYLWLKL